MFNALHVMFETQYTEQWTALDEIAERIRALGFNAPGSYAEFIRLSSIAEEPGLGDTADWREMVRQLVVGNEAVCRTARKVLQGRRRGRRRSDRRPADPAPAGAREVRLDAALAAAVGRPPGSGRRPDRPALRGRPAAQPPTGRNAMRPA